jgi:hypothetical protein
MEMGIGRGAILVKVACRNPLSYRRTIKTPPVRIYFEHRIYYLAISKSEEVPRVARCVDDAASMKRVKDATKRVLQP